MQKPKQKQNNRFCASCAYAYAYSLLDLETSALTMRPPRLPLMLMSSDNLLLRHVH